jgi:hypothetical protein
VASIGLPVDEVLFPPATFGTGGPTEDGRASHLSGGWPDAGVPGVGAIVMRALSATLGVRLRGQGDGAVGELAVPVEWQ